ncbi:ImmA/IrrE family metallo-endopeptidase [Mycobacterium asiaticum]|uniref:IrrE N-terminal-like domain-containing protein n=1 Tax=Mycobacterium asiaticum TaxID=1790 RepID=A0A1A3NPI5_MYCAS|nr:ImmA/IrrE family metallo-endopeptidase [Mycobacterium asiaticum]OBK22989.1 hypothetical protein A5635_20360 [Mycobacterium asiaticum]
MSALVVSSLADVRKYARGALSLAGATDTLPVPLADVEAAIGLHAAQDLYLAGDDVPPRFAALLRKIRAAPARVWGALGFGQDVIYLDPELSYHRRRFTHGHELGHKAMPWHQDAYYLDDDTTLDPATRADLEQEANAFAAQLLFGVDRFTEMADSRAVSLAVPLQLSTRFDTSGHAAMRHYVAHASRPLALLVLGKFTTYRMARPGLPVFDTQCVESASFRDRYGQVTDLFPDHLPLTDYPLAASAIEASSGLDGVHTEIALDTKRGKVTFVAECATLRLHFVLLRPRPRLAMHRPHVHVVHRPR